jgi:pimeloyl-ACP methyl ester carboxylesterase
MLTAETVHPEGARYTASIVCVPGLWSGAAVWRGFAGYLAHRGWECHLLELCGDAGGVAERAAAVADYVAALPTPAVLIGHDAGGLIALAAAARRAPAAIVLIAPLVPGNRAVRALGFDVRRLLALIVGGSVPPPTGRAGAEWMDLPSGVSADIARALAPDDAGVVRDVIWGRVRPLPAAGVPVLLVVGERDALLPPAAARALAGTLAAELGVLEGAGHWPFAGPSWQNAVAVVHRWLVQRLGESLLDLYAEMMAERDAGDEETE